jgi:serine-type D-Ala-D-Ala carboxypeptidase (penicillin-binding protein 5/6)
MKPAPPVTTDRTGAYRTPPVRVRWPLALVVLAGVAGLTLAPAFVFHERPRAEPNPLLAPKSAGEPDPTSVEQAEPAAEAFEQAPETVELEEETPARVYAEGARSVAFKPRLTARAYIAIDAETGDILIARRERERRPIASLTKVMTALVVIERGKLDRKAQTPVAATRVEPNREGLVKGRWYPRRLLLYSALMVSANDSADTLAYDAGHGSLKRFYRAMNGKARRLGLTDTTYTSASGLNDETNLSTALNQAILSRAALEKPLFAAIVRTRRRVVEWRAPTYAKEWVNHNRMLFSYAGTYGVKTGYTRDAGGCLAIAVRRNGHAVIAVVLGSRNTWADMPRLVRAAFARIDA